MLGEAVGVSGAQRLALELGSLGRVPSGHERGGGWLFGQTAHESPTPRPSQPPTIRSFGHDDDVSGELEPFLRLGAEIVEEPGSLNSSQFRKRIEPWLSAVLQSEHLVLLLGNGFTTALADSAGAPAPSMGAGAIHLEGVDIEAAASRVHRSTPNVEDRIRAALTLLGGLEVLGDPITASAHTRS